MLAICYLLIVVFAKMTFGLLLSQNGNITELLLKEGFARCVDWSMAVYTQGAEKLRAAER